MSNLQHFAELLWAMTERELKARYKHAVLGFLWIILNPLLQMVVIGTVLPLLFDVPINNYFLFLFPGLLAWNYFSLTITKLTPAIVYELQLIEKAKFPKEVILFSLIASHLFHTLVGYLLLSISLLIFGHISVVRLFALPGVLLWLTGIIAGIGLLTSALNVRFRDVHFFITAGVPLLFYVSPLLFSVELLPQQYHLLLMLNPLSSSFEILRWIFHVGSWPSWQLVVSNLCLTAILCGVGWLVFRREAPYFDDWA